MPKKHTIIKVTITNLASHSGVPHSILIKEWPRLLIGYGLLGGDGFTVFFIRSRISPLFMASFLSAIIIIIIMTNFTRGLGAWECSSLEVDNNNYDVLVQVN